MINKKELRETLGGGSFHKRFHQCERSFYYRYIEGLMPESSTEALIFGSAIHEAAAKYWEGKISAECITHGLDVINELAVNYEEKKIDLLQIKLSLVFTELFNELEKLKTSYEYVEHEETFHLWLLTGDIAIKPDIVLRNKYTGKLEVFDYKTTGVAADTQITNQLYSNQPRLYSAGIREKYKLNYYPIWNTIEVYARKVARKDEFTIAIQTVPMSMGAAEIQDVLFAYESLLNRVQDRYEYYCKVKDFHVYTRMGDCSKCSFKDICQQGLSNIDTEITEGFERDPWVIDGLVEKYLQTGRFERK